MRVRVARPGPGRWSVLFEGTTPQEGGDCLLLLVNRADVTVEFDDPEPPAAAAAPPPAPDADDGPGPADTIGGGPLFGARAPVPGDDPQSRPGEAEQGR